MEDIGLYDVFKVVYVYNESCMAQFWIHYKEIFFFHILLRLCTIFLIKGKTRSSFEVI